MRVKLLVSLIVLVMAVGCKKKGEGEEQSNPVEDAVKAVAQAATSAAGGGAECPECPECPAKEECPECEAGPPPLAKVELDKDAADVQVYKAQGFAFNVAEAGEFQIDVTSGDGDPEIRLLRQGETDPIATNDDYGDGTDARIYAFLAAGDYEVLVRDIAWGAIKTSAKVAAAPDVPGDATIKPGEKLEVAVEEVEEDRASVVKVSLEIAEAGSYVITTANEENDGYLWLIGDNALIAENDDGGEGNNPQIEAELEAGTYTIRLRDIHNEAATFELSVEPAAE